MPILFRGAALLLGGALCVSGLHAQDTTRYDCLLWKISGNGLAKPSYLYGTMHVSNKLAFHLTDEFFMALESADAVALEMDPSTWLPEMCRSDWFAGLASLGGLGSGSKDLYNTAFTVEPPGREEIAALLAEDPETVNSLLYRMSESGADHEENTFLDLFIYQCGRKLGKRVVGLERFEDAMRLYVKAMMPDEDDAEDKSGGTSKRRKLYELGLNAQQLTEDAYRAQDLTRMDTLFDYMLPQHNARKYLLDARNVGFVEHMEEVMRQGALFTGVGAAHLPGRNGVIAMLRAKGFTVEPLYGKVTERSKARRDKLESMGLPLPLSTQWTADSLFRMDLPSELCELSPLMTRGVRTEIATDNVNGTFYSVQRIPTYAGMQGLTPEDILQRIDSALYEAVPGHIDHRKRIIADNGWPGLELRSTTAKGRRVHYRILVGPFEIFVFKRGGKGNALGDKQGEKVFASIHAMPVRNAMSSTWSPDRAGCSLTLAPTRWVEQAPAEARGSVSADRSSLALSTDERTNAQYFFASATYPDVKYIEEDSFELHVLAERFSESLSATGIQHHDTTVAGAPACFSTCHAPHGDTLRIMTALHGPEYFLLAARSTPAEADAYFSSFKLVPKGLAGGYALHRDSLLQFTVRTASPMGHAQDMMMDLGQDLLRRFRSPGHARDDSHEAAREKMVYTSSISGDAVSVERRRFHRFWEETDTLHCWDEMVKDLADDGSLKVSRLVTSGPLEARRMDLLLTDTASSRAIRVRLILRPDALYKLRACVDSMDVTTAWVDTFFTSFTPIDTARHEGIFVPKGDVFMAWLTGTDTLQARQARDSFRTVRLLDRHAQPLIGYLNGPGRQAMNSGERSAALGKLAELHAPGVLPYLKRAHDAAGDTLDLRLEALQAMALQHTREATAMLKQLVLVKPPLSDDGWRISELFEPFYDSLATATVLFPAIERLSRYPEYEGPVRHLKAALVDAHLLPAMPAAEVDQLIIDAEAALQRAVSADRESDDDDGPGYSSDDDEGYDDDDVPQRMDRAMRMTMSRMRRWMPGDAGRHGQRSIGLDEVSPWSSDITTYLRLLLPLYNDQRAHAFFDKAMASGVDDIVLGTALLLVEHGKAVDPALWARYADRDDVRLWLFRTSRERGRPELMAADSMTARHNADACMFANWKDAVKDSASFIRMREGMSGSGPVNVYFYRTRAKTYLDDDEGRWRVGYVVFPASKGDDPFKGAVNGWVEDNYAADELDEAMDKAMRELRYRGRHRWRERPTWERGYWGGLD